MSRSTTATTTYNLVKYSRSYPQAAGSDQLDQEWQHFTNPVIRLVVDVKKASSDDLENFRTRILWTLQASNDCMDVDQREVVFEDLDLLAFSSIPLLKDRIVTSQGLPLKAVYRDAVIGIRYLHPRIVPAGATPSYRRFQITFQSASQATCFIESIKFVCPCKANQVPPVSRTINRAATMVQASVMGPPVGDTASGIPRPSVPPGSGRMQVPHGSSMSSHLSFAPETPSQQRDVLLSSATQRPWDQPPPFNACTPVTSLLPRSSTASSERQRLPINTSVSPWDSSSTNLSAFTQYGNSDNSVRKSGRASVLPALDSDNGSRPSSAITASSSSVNYSADTSLYYPRAPLVTGEHVPSILTSSDPHQGPSPSQRHLYSAHPSSEPSHISMAPSENSYSRRASTTLHGTVENSYASTPTHPTSSAPEEMLSLALPAPSPTEPIPAPIQQTAAKENISPTSQRILACLEETPSLYDLSRGDLEEVVAKVVREEGFLKLLEQLDSMWKIKSVLDLPCA